MEGTDFSIIDAEHFDIQKEKRSEILLLTHTKTKINSRKVKVTRQKQGNKASRR
jgi:hypothetical protein